MTYILRKSDKKEKKYMMEMPDDDMIHYFGATGYEDYTTHKDEDRAKLYRKRHRKDRINNKHTAGALSWFILWSAPSIRQGIKNYEKRFNVNVNYEL